MCKSEGVTNLVAPNPKQDAAQALLSCSELISSAIATPRECAIAATDALVAALRYRGLLCLSGCSPFACERWLPEHGMAPLRWSPYARREDVALYAWSGERLVGDCYTPRTLEPEAALAFARLLVGHVGEVDPEGDVLAFLEQAENEDDAVVRTSAIATEAV